MGIRILHVLEAVDERVGSPALLLRGLGQELGEVSVRSGFLAERVAPCEGFSETPQIAQGNGAAASLDRCNVVHIHGWGYALASQMAKAARSAGVPFVVSPLGGLSPLDGQSPGIAARIGFALSDRRLLRSAGRLLAMNTREAEALRDRGLTRVETLACGFDPAAFGVSASGAKSGPNEPASKAPAAAPPRRRLLLLAPITPEEGCVALLKALAELGTAMAGWVVVLAGPKVAGYTEMLEAGVARKGASDRVEFAAPSNLAAQLEEIRRADLVVAPSLRANAPVSLLAAVACGVPAVASNLIVPDGLDELVESHGPTRHELARALRRAFEMNDGARRGTISLARDFAVSRYGWPVLASRYADLYREVAKGGDG